jgi:hypothetical protein
MPKFIDTLILSLIDIVVCVDFALYSRNRAETLKIILY